MSAAPSPHTTPHPLSHRNSFPSPIAASPTPTSRRVKFAASPSIREIGSGKGDTQRRSIPNTGIHGQLGQRSKFSTAASSFRRMSMFARNYNPSTEGDKIEITCIPPLIRFRRAARVIRMLCSVCIACKKEMFNSVTQNNWIALKEALLRETDVSRDQNREKKKALTTDDPELTFDLSKFRRYKDMDVMPFKIKELLRKRPADRTPDEILNIMRTMQKMENFARYPLSIQRKLCECAWIQMVEPNRVVLRQQHVALCVYYVISGRLVANGEEDGHMVTTLLKRGDKFGEEEILSETKRTATVMSQDTAELFVVHGEDYKDICFSKVSKDISSLSICKNNPVFHHWPLQKLIENTNAWTIQNYKPGELIVEDSGRCDWVYIIKSGQCKVVKCLKPGEPEEDPARIKKILARHARFKLLKEIELKNMAQEQSEVSESVEEGGSAVPPSSTFFTTPLSRPQTHGNYDDETAAIVQDAIRNRSQSPMKRSPFLVSLYGPKVNKPVYVALEVLGAGDSFGFLAVLPKDQRGSSVSLISNGSEVLQINKKFFQKFADETVYSLINMKFPPFPKQHEILQNLRESFMWKDYKRQTLDDALSHLYRPVVVQQEHRDNTITL